MTQHSPQQQPHSASASKSIVLLKGNFGDLDRLLTEADIAYVDGFLFDLGVTSPQLDVAGARVLLPGGRASGHADGSRVARH